VKAAALAALAVLVLAGSSRAADTPHQAQLLILYAHDHHGRRAVSAAELMPYSTQFERILVSCASLQPLDVMNATVYMSGQAAAFPGAGPMSNLIMLQAMANTVSRARHENCWDAFNVVVRRIEAADATKLIVDRRQVTALFVYDHQGKQPRDDVDLLPYAQAFQKIMASCTVGLFDLPSDMVNLSDQATELGTRTVTTMMMMAAIARRIHWSAPRDCTSVFNTAEGFVEGGGR